MSNGSVSAASVPLGLEARADQFGREADARYEALADRWPEPMREGSGSDAGEQPQTLAEALLAEMRPWTDEELEAARKPHPHLFQSGFRGALPVGEVTVWAGHGRGGKTTAIAAAVSAYVVGHALGGLWSDIGYSAIIYSAEDDRGQYAQKIAALVSLMSDADAELVRNRVIVPNLWSKAYSPFRELVRVLDGQPVASATVDAVIEVIQALQHREAPPRLVVFETASTLSEAEETNTGFRALILALRRIARETGVAVVLSHHVSQAALSSLPDLQVSTSDIRGGTVLVNNARQTAMVVNLGSDEDPFPERDARTVLRKMVVTPGDGARVTALIPLDSSKGMDPPPVFFRWAMTEWGPAAMEVEPPAEIRGKAWRKVLEMVGGRRAEARSEAKAEREDATAQARQEKVLQAIAWFESQEQPATRRRIRERCGMSNEVVGQALSHLETNRRVSGYPTKAGGQSTTAFRIGAGGGTNG